MPVPTSGDLVILVRRNGAADQPYPNEWDGERLAVLYTHQRVLNQIVRQGPRRVYVQIAPEGVIVGSGLVRGWTEVAAPEPLVQFAVPFHAWEPARQAPAGRSFGHAWYVVR